MTHHAVLLVLALATGCSPDGASPTEPAIVPSTTVVTIPGGSSAVVVEVLDGDSLRVDLGTAVDEVRLLGINAPEVGECWSDQARAALARMVTGGVTLVGDERDQFGRLLAQVYDGSDNLNLRLVEEGAAIATSTEHIMAVAFQSAEEAAYISAAGLWSPNACGPVDPTGVSIRRVVFDAPGADQENPNGEYAVIGNDGEPVDLTGWVLRDESSTHRFRFPEGFELGRGEVVLIRSGCGGEIPGELYWCADGAVWSNGGDMALLLDRYGNVVERLRF
jgi:endonuclease YncB( thermonuclease family)